jgi:hypothetical protein
VTVSAFGDPIESARCRRLLVERECPSAILADVHAAGSSLVRGILGTSGRRGIDEECRIGGEHHGLDLDT